MQPGVLETKKFFFQKKSKTWTLSDFFSLYNFWCHKSDRNIVSERSSTPAKKWLRPWCENFRLLKKSIINLSTNRTEMQVSAIACQFCIPGSQMLQLTFQYVFESIEKIDWYLDEWNAPTGFWKERVCFSGKIKQFSDFGSMELKTLRCNSLFQEHYLWTIYSQTNDWRTMIKEIEKIISKESSLLSKIIHSRMKKLAVCLPKVSILRDQTQLLTVKYHFTSKKTLRDFDWRFLAVFFDKTQFQSSRKVILVSFFG